MEESRSIWMILATIIITALIAGAGVFIWQEMNMQTKSQDFEQQIETLQKQAQGLEQETQEAKNTIAEAEKKVLNDAQLLNLRVSYDILLWSGQPVFQYSEDPSIFVYINRDAKGQHIWKYSTGNFETYMKNNNPIISDHKTLLYLEKLSNPDDEFRSVGFDGNKFVFTQTSYQNSPGPCFSDWTYPTLYAINIAESNPTRQDYSPSSDILTREQTKQAQCQKELGIE